MLSTLKFPKSTVGRTKRPRGPHVWDPCLNWWKRQYIL